MAASSPTRPGLPADHEPQITTTTTGPCLRLTFGMDLEEEGDAQFFERI